jgi:cytoskeletal protein RodZ
MARGRPSKTPSTLGLVEFRQDAGVTLEIIVEQTKITKRFLEAIESGAYDQLPGGVFDISYLRQYAHATGYPVDRLLDHYRGSMGERTPVQSETNGRGWLGLGRFFSHG